MFDPADFGRITPDEQADALRTVIATFLTSVVRPGEAPPRNAVTAEILDILDAVPENRREPVAQLFAMMALRLRRTAPPRRTAFRLALEAALLTRGYAGEPPPDGEPEYLAAGQPGMEAIGAACAILQNRMVAEGPEDPKCWLTAHAIAAAMVETDRHHALGGARRERGDLAVAEFLLHAAAQYLAGTTPDPRRS